MAESSLLIAVCQCRQFAGWRGFLGWLFKLSFVGFRFAQFGQDRRVAAWDIGDRREQVFLRSRVCLRVAEIDDASVAVLCPVACEWLDGIDPFRADGFSAR